MNFFSRSIMFICFALVFTSTLLAESTDTWAVGDGNQSSPYLIRSRTDLYNLAARVNAGSTYAGKYFKVTAPINLADINWIPIGSKTRIFEGHFDGNAQVISNLTIQVPIGGTDTTFVGLFGNVKGGKLSNIYLKKVYINILEPASNLNVGGLVGMTTGAIDSCYVAGDGFIQAISGRNGGKINIGGIVGNLKGSLSNSYSHIEISTVSTGEVAAGGAIGASWGPIAHVYSRGKVSGTSKNSEAYVGGLVGITYSSITNTYATGRVLVTAPSKKDFKGGITGFKPIGGTVNHSYYDKESTGCSDDDKGSPTTTSYMKSEAMVVALNQAESIWRTDISPVLNNGYPIFIWQTPVQKITLSSSNNLKLKLESTSKINAKATSGLKVIYSSDSHLIASVSEAGVITANASGTTTIRLNQPGDNNYKPAQEVIIKVLVYFDLRIEANKIDVSMGDSAFVRGYATASDSYITLKTSGLKYGVDFVVEEFANNGNNFYITINDLCKGFNVVFLNNGIVNKKKRTLKLSVSGLPKDWIMFSDSKYVKFNIAPNLQDPPAPVNKIVNQPTALTNLDSNLIAAKTYVVGDAFNRHGTLTGTLFTPPNTDVAPLGWLSILTDSTRILRAYTGSLIAPRAEKVISADSIFEIGATFQKKPALKLITFEPWAKRANVPKKNALSVIDFKKQPSTITVAFKPTALLYNKSVLNSLRKEGKGFADLDSAKVDQLGAQLVFSYSNKNEFIYVKEAPIGAIVMTPPTDLTISADSIEIKKRFYYTVNGNHLGYSPKAYYEYLDTTKNRVKTISCKVMWDKKTQMSNGEVKTFHLALPKRPKNSENFKLIIDNRIGLNTIPLAPIPPFPPTK